MALFFLVHTTGQGRYPWSHEGVVWDLGVACFLGPHPFQRQVQSAMRPNSTIGAGFGAWSCPLCGFVAGKLAMYWCIAEMQAARAPHPTIMGGACADAVLASPPESGSF